MVQEAPLRAKALGTLLAEMEEPLRREVHRPARAAAPVAELVRHLTSAAFAASVTTGAFAATHTGFVGGLPDPCAEEYLRGERAEHHGSPLFTGPDDGWSEVVYGGREHLAEP